MSAFAIPALDRPVLGHGDRCEEIQRAAAAQIIRELPAQIARQQAEWDQRDKDFAKLLEKQFHRVVIQPVPAKRVFTGMKPSLVESRWDLWPALAVYAGESDPSADREQPDQYSSYDVKLVIEVMARIGPFPVDSKDRDYEDEIDRVHHRLASAVQSSISADETLGGVCSYIKRPPKTTSGLPFARRETEGTGGELIFQGRQLTYTMTTLSW